MRKKCEVCGFICFTSDENCKRCGSHQLSMTTVPNSSLIQETSEPKSKKLKFVKYFVFMIFAQFGILLLGAILGVPVFKVFYEPVFIAATKIMFIGHADVIIPLLLIILTFSAYAIACSYLLVYSRFREAVFMPLRKDFQKTFTELRAKLNGK